MAKKEKSVAIKSDKVIMDAATNTTMIQFVQSIVDLHQVIDLCYGDRYNSYELLKKTLLKIDLEIDHSHKGDTEIEYLVEPFYIRISDSSHKWRRPDDGYIFFDIELTGEKFYIDTNSMSGIKNTPDCIIKRIERTLEDISEGAAIWIQRIQKTIELFENNLMNYEFFDKKTPLDAGLDELAKSWSASTAPIL